MVPKIFKSNPLALGVLAAISITPLLIGGTPAFAAKMDRAQLKTAKVSHASRSNANTILRLGSQGESVRQLQAALKKDGFYKGSINGMFDRQTRSAVMVFQRSHHIKADGVVGAKTRSAIS
ncbi:peptidoglycan-binding domain-containing protein [Argonema antarcticum]|uniref:peptidoglycan-binding domain-containing protein n=1 Tax=Argonema antarcticum TaxID=2942763 RepID=UPI002012A612|nr:peptidoglycan-binding domain-containing protein [Argonema antarcticum]MCL1470166.1 peptidoglycan-binding protein [Argonema antarcticum A004/B2]